MVWIYIFIPLLILIFHVFCKVKDIKSIRVFGLELRILLFFLLVLLLIIGEVFLPMPQYYIKHKLSRNLNGINRGLTLNEIVEVEVLNSGIEFDDDSFRVLDSYGMHFNHLFLVSYEIDEKEEVRLLHFEKNIFGNMKPKYALDDGNNIISEKDNGDDSYNTYFEDGIFAGYLVAAGFGNDQSQEITIRLDKYRIARTPPKGYFMWIDMVKEPWKSLLVKILIYTTITFTVSRFQNNKIEPIKFYNQWEKGDDVFKCTYQSKEIRLNEK